MYGVNELCSVPNDNDSISNNPRHGTVAAQFSIMAQELTEQLEVYRSREKEQAELLEELQATVSELRSKEDQWKEAVDRTSAVISEWETRG